MNSFVCVCVDAMKNGGIAFSRKSFPFGFSAPSKKTFSHVYTALSRALKLRSGSAMYVQAGRMANSRLVGRYGVTQWKRWLSNTIPRSFGCRHDFLSVSRDHWSCLATKHSRIPYACFDLPSNRQQFTSSVKDVGMSSVSELASKVNQSIQKLETQIKTRGIDVKHRDLAKLLDDEDVWTQPERANKLAREHAALNRIIDTVKNLSYRGNSALELALLANEESKEDSITLISECFDDLTQCLKESEEFSVELLLDGKLDNKSCFLEICAGAGGAESCDFSEMLANMYLKWGENNDFQVKVIEFSPAEEGGYRSATVRIDGHNAYGWLKAENGVHRLVRISIHDSARRRQTCFSRVVVLPIVEDDDDDDIEIPASDMRIDTYRSSGAGGQHVNCTDSAVRITHIPTGIVAQSQDQRSQIQNRKLALAVLKSRILQLKLDKEAAERKEFNRSLGENTWGNQIRSYILHPYKLVKDHRTDFQTSQAAAVLNGEPEFLTPFMRSYLIQSSSDKQ